jgi:hypothetical protein
MLSQGLSRLPPDRKALAIQGMVRISHPYLSDSPVKRFGTQNVRRSNSMRSWTAWSTTTIASGCVANRSAERRLTRTPWLDPHSIPNGETNPSPRATPPRPTSIGIGGRHQTESPADFVGMRRCDRSPPLFLGHHPEAKPAPAAWARSNCRRWLSRFPMTCVMVDCRT